MTITKPRRGDSELGDRSRSLDSIKARQILAGAKAAFMDLGYEGASTDEIARRANVSKATVYAYFSTKQRLFEVMVQEECARQSGAIIGLVDTEAPLDEVLRHLARGFIRLMLTPFMQDLYRVAIAEARRFPELAHTFYNSGPGTGMKKFSAILDIYVERGDVCIEDTRFAAAQFESLAKADFFNKAILGIKTEYSEEEVAEYIDRAISAFRKIYP